jgi:hypothetical protein
MNGRRLKTASQKLIEIFFLYTIAAPVPPNVNEGRITNGNQIPVQSLSLSGRTYKFQQVPMEHLFFFSNCLNCSLSSVMLMALTSTPIIFIPKSAQIPFHQLQHKFKAVCPPIVGKTASI